MTRILGTTFAALLVLSMIVASKFSMEHHLASSTGGLQGELRTPKIDVLFLGSSHMRQSYDIAQFQSVTGKSAFIVSYNGLDPSSMKLILNEILQSPSQRPKLIVLDGYCELYAHRPDIEDDRLYFDAPPQMKAALLNSYVRETGGWQAWTGVWELAVNRGSDAILTWPLVHTTLDSLSYRGSYYGKTVPGTDPSQFTSYHLPLVNARIDGKQLNALQEMIQIIHRDGIKVLLVDAPMPEPVENEPAVIALKTQLIDFAQRSGITFYDGATAFPIQDPSLFGDANHLSTAGRAVYTKAFAEMLLRHADEFGLDAPRTQPTNTNIKQSSRTEESTVR